MIPLRLQLRNFMCYGEDAAPLVLDGIHVACLSGDNGHGKSALLDALTWALWGQARGKSDDDLVKMGQTAMEVELEFAIGGLRYRVIRKRALKGKRGVTGLEFQVRDGDAYRPVTGDSVGETQRKISATLHMEYGTFVNSALLLQGRADEFTVKSPAERKKVLADVLGLGVYGVYEAKARDLAREAEQQRRELIAAIAEIDRELVHRPDYEALRAQVAADLARVEASRVTQEANLRRALEAKQVLDAKSRQVDELQQQQQRDRRQLVDLEARLVSDRTALRQHQAVLAARAEVEAGYQQLLALRAREQDLARLAALLLDLTQRQAAIDQAVARARATLQSGADAQRAILSRAKEKVARRPSFERDLAVLRIRLDALASLEARRDGLREAAQSDRNVVDTMRARNDQLKKEMVLLKEKLSLLSGEGASCPVCGGVLGASGRQTLADRYEADGKQFGDEFRNNASLIRDAEARLAQAQRDLDGVRQHLAEREQLRARAGALQQSLAEVDAALQDVAGAEEAIAATDDRLVRADFAHADQAALAALRGEIAALGYDAAEHARVRRELAALQPFESRSSALQAAKTAAGLLAEKLLQNEDLVASRRQILADREAVLDTLCRDVAQRSHVLAELADAQDTVDALGRAAADLRVKLGRADQLLLTCDQLAIQQREKSASLRRASEEKAVYDELALAFGKKGIQAMIIDTALPEIEDEANLLLARLTDNRMYVKLETQREAKSVDGVIETLDIKIADELGYRQYEMYSGGEAFRVNFALRIALSKLLARRAGARLQTLIIDEGFGTQDAAGRERLVESINGVAPDFDCILAITHIQELKDAFPVRIDIVKGPTGSQIAMND